MKMKKKKKCAKQKKSYLKGKQNSFSLSAIQARCGRIHSSLFDIKVDLNVDSVAALAMSAASHGRSLGAVLLPLLLFAAQDAVLAVGL